MSSKIKQGLLSLFCGLLLWFTGSGVAEANNANPVFEAQVGTAVGGPIGLAFSDMLADSTTEAFTWLLLVRVRSPRYSALAPETNLVTGGFGVNLLVDALTTPYFRFHLFDLGVCVNLFSPISVQRVRRDWDITLGGGVEIKLPRNLNLVGVWRAYVPDPVKLISDYGDFARPVVKEALVGGQLWFGLSRTFAW